jgi:hypothetical protein
LAFRFAAVAICAAAALPLIADDGSNPDIYKVAVSGAATQPVFTITGMGFGSKDSPWVWLGSQALTIASHTDTTVITNPAPASAFWIGTFDLLIAEGHGNKVPTLAGEQKNWNDADEVAVVLGAAGAPGLPGATGPLAR